MTAEKKVFSSDNLSDMIASKFAGPSYVTLSEVRDGTGAYAARSADMMAFGVWPSRGLEIIGFEIKSYRGDWLRELKTPAKAESIAPYCDKWYIVASDDIVKLEEVPTAWGWLAPSGRGLKVNKESACAPAVPLDRSFLMSIVRNISRGYVPRTDVEELARIKAKSIADATELQNKYRFERAEELSKSVEAFESASGIKIDNYRLGAKETGDIVKMVIDRSLHYHTKNLVKSAEDIKAAYDALMAHPLYQGVKEES